MRLTPLATSVLVLALSIAACGDDDDDEPRAQATTTSTSSSTASTTSTTGDEEDCAGADPVPPAAADGSPAEIVATAGDVSFAIVDHGASVDVVSLFRTVDCAFEALFLDGAPTALAVGGSVTHGDGIRCEGDAITVLTATSDDGATYQATSVTYEVDDGELVEVDREASTIDAQSQAGELDGYYRLDCEA